MAASSSSVGSAVVAAAVSAAAAPATPTPSTQETQAATTLSPRLACWEKRAPTLTAFLHACNMTTLVTFAYDAFEDEVPEQLKATYAEANRICDAAAHAAGRRRFRE